MSASMRLPPNIFSINADRLFITRPTFPRSGRPPIGVHNGQKREAELLWLANQPGADAEDDANRESPIHEGPKLGT